MGYKLDSVTIHINNCNDKNVIAEIWQDIENGSLPLLFDNHQNFIRGLSPVSKYTNYQRNEGENYDLSILAVKSDFFKIMDSKADEGIYKKYDVSSADGDVNSFSREAWNLVISDEKGGLIKRAYTEDYESTVPSKYTKDGKAHCYLYISIKN